MKEKLKAQAKVLAEKLLNSPAWRKYAIVLGVVLGIHLVFLLLFVAGNSKPQGNSTEEEQAAEKADPRLEFPPGPPSVLTPPLDRAGAHQGDFNGWYESKQVQAGILFDVKNNKVLWEKNPDQALPIGSIAKLMTMLLTFEAIDAGMLQLETIVPVSAEAAAIRTSPRLELVEGETFSLRELLIGTAIRGANDSAYLIGAQLYNGNTGKFIQAMNFRAEDLKMEKSGFYSSHGLPVNGKESFSTANDLTILAAQLLRYPKLLEWTGKKEDFFREKEHPKRQLLKNFNNLVFKDFPGVDGLAVGQSSLAGFSVVFSCMNKDRRMIGVVLGVPDFKDRDNFVKKLLDWAEKK